MVLSSLLFTSSNSIHVWKELELCEPENVFSHMLFIRSFSKHQLSIYSGLCIALSQNMQKIKLTRTLDSQALWLIWLKNEKLRGDKMPWKFFYYKRNATIRQIEKSSIKRLTRPPLVKDDRRQAALRLDDPWNVSPGPTMTMIFWLCCERLYEEMDFWNWLSFMISSMPHVLFSQENKKTNNMEPRVE